VWSAELDTADNEKIVECTARQAPAIDPEDHGVERELLETEHLFQIGIDCKVDSILVDKRALCAADRVAEVSPIYVTANLTPLFSNGLAGSHVSLR
jgi:hypothetical protein